MVFEKCVERGISSRGNRNIESGLSIEVLFWFAGRLKSAPTIAVRPRSGCGRVFAGHLLHREIRPLEGF
jgi:hypothetical protein